jgi:membrane protease YdiL (CAAX protease family)
MNAVAAVAITACVFVIALIAAPWLYRLWAASYGPAIPSPALSLVVLYAAILLPLYAAAFGLYAWEKRAPTHSSLNRWYAGVLGLAVGAFAFLFTVLGTSIAGVVQPGTKIAAGAGIVLASLLTAFQAFGEEYFFRGWLQPLLASQWGIPIGLLGTSALFACAHLLLQPFSVLAAANVFLAGMLFGVLALRTTGLAAPFAAHWVWNWLEASVMGLVPNPGVSPLGSFFDFDLKGSAILGGGPDGLNGSIIVTVVLSLCVAGLTFGRFAGAAETRGLSSKPAVGQSRRQRSTS